MPKKTELLMARASMHLADAVAGFNAVNDPAVQAVLDHLSAAIAALPTNYWSSMFAAENIGIEEVAARLNSKAGATSLHNPVNPKS